LYGDGDECKRLKYEAPCARRTARAVSTQRVTREEEKEEERGAGQGAAHLLNDLSFGRWVEEGILRTHGILRPRVVCPR
jgi:hypothetical protein